MVGYFQFLKNQDPDHLDFFISNFIFNLCNIDIIIRTACIEGKIKIYWKNDSLPLLPFKTCI